LDLKSGVVQLRALPYRSVEVGMILSTLPVADQLDPEPEDMVKMGWMDAHLDGARLVDD
jgi:hypothetical protein